MICRPGVKINLGLSVLRRRPDGYHDLETLFVPCPEFHDVLEIVKGDDFSETSAALFAKYGPVADSEADEGLLGGVQEFGGSPDRSGGAETTSEPDGEPPMLSQRISPDGKLMITIGRKEGVAWNPLEDLTAKAYRLLSEDFNLGPAKIFLEKCSPVGAGLGGGSADAAFAIKVLNKIFGLGLDDSRMASYAAKLGSDTSFFVYDKPMVGTGRGEILTPLDEALGGADTDVDKIDFDGNHPDLLYEVKVIVPEGIEVSTAEAYKGIVPREASGSSRTPLIEALKKPIDEWKDCLSNDFEGTVFAKHPELPAIKRSLYDSGAVYASMSGSGSALFAIYRR